MGTNEAAMSSTYRNLLLTGRGLSDVEQILFGKMAWWSDAVSSDGGRVFVLSPRGEDGELEGYTDMWKLSAYSLAQMHPRVVESGEKYSVVWVQAGDHRLSFWAARKVRRSLPDQYSGNLAGVHVVHPSWSYRVMELALWPFVDESFWDSFYCHERVEFLEQHMRVKELDLPADVIEYDQYLDKEAQYMSEQAAFTTNYAVSGIPIDDHNEKH